MIYRDGCPCVASVVAAHVPVQDSEIQEIQYGSAALALADSGITGEFHFLAHLFLLLFILRIGFDVSLAKVIQTLRQPVSEL